MNVASWCPLKTPNVQGLRNILGDFFCETSEISQLRKKSQCFLVSKKLIRNKKLRETKRDLLEKNKALEKIAGRMGYKTREPLRHLLVRLKERQKRILV